MGVALFFHLTRSTAEDVVRLNAGRAMARGWRVLVRGGDLQRLSTLDDRLWEEPAESFLPHGMAGGDHDAEQPLLLTMGREMANSPQALLALDGAEVTVEEIEALERVWIVFDGLDPQAMEVARAQWRSLTGAGAEAEYWSEASGRWQMQTAKRKDA